MDLLSLDVEGAELTSFRPFLFTGGLLGPLWLSTILIGLPASIWGLLHGNGYVRVQCIETDDIFVKLSILLQNEVRVDPRECEYAMISVDCERILKGKDTRCWSLVEDINLPPTFMDYIKTQESQHAILRRVLRLRWKASPIALKSDMNAPRLKTPMVNTLWK